MAQLHQMVAVCLSALISVSSGSGDWDYGKNGPGHWATSFPQFCAGDRQSPVDLSTQSSQQEPLLRQSLLYQKSNLSSVKLTLTNDGHKTQLSWSPDLVITMGINSIVPTHTAAQLHWHWGADNLRGSEHTVDKRTYAAEGHLVFYNSHDYASISEASNRPNGLAVLGVLYEVSEHDNPLFLFIERLLTNDTLVAPNSYVDMSVNASELNIVEQLLPADRTAYFRYDGSLTTPACYESVLWTVYRQTVPISGRQLGLLRRLKFADNSSMVDNFRPPLPLNPGNRPGTPRTVYRTFSAGSVPRLALGSLASAVLLARWGAAAVSVA